MTKMVERWQEEDVVFEIEEVKKNKLFRSGGKGSGHHGHSGRPGQVGGSQDDDGDTTPKDYNLFMTYSRRWNSASDYDARGIAYDLAYRDKQLREHLQEEAFGKVLQGNVTLYRVGNLSEYDITSFFTRESSAQSYQKRMGVDTIRKYKADARYIIPSGAGSGEVWVRNDFIE